METAPINIVRTGEPSRTALRVAILRAAHQLLDEPIVLQDPVALPILGAKLEAEVRDDPFKYNDSISRGLRAALVVRSRVAEDDLSESVANGVHQYVVLGAGLDTFAYRNPHQAAGLRVFEVDHPSTQQWKRRLLQDAGIPLPESLTFVGVDFERSTLRQALAEAGVRPDQPTCFSWLGVTMYLTEAAVMDTLKFVAGFPRGSSITFDFRVPLSMLNPIQRAVAEMMGQRAEAVGERWLSAFEPERLRAQVAALGFSDVQALDAETLNRRYFYRRKDGLQSVGRLMLAKV